MIGNDLIGNHTIGSTSLLRKLLRVLESLGLSGQISQRFIITFQETITLSETIWGSIKSFITETISLTEQTIKQVRVFLTDTINLSDYKLLGIIIKDIIGLTDTIKGDIKAFFTETISLSEKTIKQVRTFLTETIILESYKKVYYYLPIQEIINLTDTFRGDMKAFFQEVIGFVEHITLEGWGFIKKGVDTLNFTKDKGTPTDWEFRDKEKW